MIWLCVAALIGGGLTFAAYRQGLKDGRAVKEEQVIQPLFNLPEKQSSAEPTEEEKLLAWAEKYEG